MSPKMKIVFLKPNQAWILLFSDAPVDIKGKTFFEKKEDLLWELGFKTMKEFTESQKRQHL